MDDMRKAFEAWAAEFGVGCEHEGFAWTVWQAATLAERERCLLAATDDRDWDCFDGSFVAGRIADAIRNP